MIILKICIKQSDIQKREAQVRIMARIYIVTQRRWLRGLNAMTEEVNAAYISTSYTIAQDSWNSLQTPSDLWSAVLKNQRLPDPQAKAWK
jgi:plasmid maintenance system antidote protein VapI